MDIHLILVGKTSFSYLEKGMLDYTKRLKRYCNFTISIVSDEPSKKNSNEIVKHKEGQRILSKLGPKDYVILLDDKGKQPTSIELAKNIQKINYTHTNKTIVFVVGGAYGFSDEVYGRANDKYSLSKLTFSHQIIRLLFLEQLYRAHTIIKGEPYHHE